MILDLLFALSLLLMVISGRKRGIINIILGLVSGIVALILAFTFQADIKSSVEQTDIYADIHTAICTSVEQKLTEAAGDIQILGIMTEGSTAAEITDQITGGIISLFIFVLAFAALRIAGYIINTLFKLPVLRLFNGVLGMIWNGVIVIAITYIILAVFGSGEFFSSLLESSIIVKYMYENNLLVQMFIK